MKYIAAVMFVIAFSQSSVTAQEAVRRNPDRVVVVAHSPETRRPSVFTQWLGYLWPGQWSFDFGGRTANRRSGICELELER